MTLAEQNAAVAQTKLAEARYRRDFYDNDKSKHETLDKADRHRAEESGSGAGAIEWRAGAAQRAASHALESVMLQAQVNQASNAYSLTVASEAVAAANVVELQAGPTPEEIALAEAKVQQAQPR